MTETTTNDLTEMDLKKAKLKAYKAKYRATNSEKIKAYKAEYWGFGNNGTESPVKSCHPLKRQCWLDLSENMGLNYQKNGLSCYPS